MKRVFVIVLDSVGAGHMPDAHLFGDVGAHTLRSVSSSDALHIPNLIRLGIGNIDGLSFLGKVEKPLAATAKMAERSMGKDTTIGHWELAGLISPQPLPTYPEGFPDEVIEAFCRATGRGVLANKPYSGTQVIADFGERHVASGDLIVYTSADSVFQIAAHEDIVPLETLYEYCRMARRILTGKHAVGRVIARPFVGQAGQYTRTGNRRDFSLEPYGTTLLDVLSEQGLDTVAVGKIGDIFAARGISDTNPTHSNGEGMAETLRLAKTDFHGLCFVNLVDFDMLYGHRNDVDGYAAALSAFDAWLPELLDCLGEEDLLIVTADHGCDPAFAGTDHTREYVPMLAYGPGVRPVDLGIRTSFSVVAATVAEALGVPFATEGKSFLKEILHDDE